VPSRSNARVKSAPLRAAWIAVAALLLGMPLSALGQETVERSSSGDITDRDIKAALKKVREDPNMAEDRKIRMLKWVKDEEDKKRQKDMSWVLWLRELFGWFAQNGRFLFWGVIAVLAGLLLVYVWRLVRAWGVPERSRRIDAPSFVRDLDIRPESLPPDIGATARKLWDDGEHRHALALLYRGLLSRLVHVHNVPIRDSSTEGDCLALASRHLATEERKIYVTSLVRVWQRAVYGGETIPTESVYALCDEFSQALDAPSVSEPAAGPRSAGAAA
jgi:hypothetical protein